MFSQMNKVIVLLLSGALLFALPCMSKAQTASVETKQPNSDYQPAFKGQTRIGAVVTKTPYESKVLTSSLQAPWGIAPLPDGRFIITERGGTIRIVSASGNVGGTINGVPKVNSDGQGGLLGICIDPAFAKNRMVYWAFSEKLAEGNLTAVAKARLSSDEKSLENVTVIYRATPAYNGEKRITCQPPNISNLSKKTTPNPSSIILFVMPQRIQSA